MVSSSRVSRLRPALAVLVLAVAAGAFAADASSAAAAKVHVLAPREDQLVAAGKRPVRVRVEMPSGWRVTAELRRVGRKQTIPLKLRRIGGGAFGGSIPQAKMVPGRNHLVVTARRGKQERYREVHFTLGRRSAGMLRLSGPGARPATSVRIVAHTGHATDFGAKLNGRSIGSSFVLRGPHRRIASLGADDGLHFGVNHLRVTAFDRYAGRYKTLRRTFVIGRDRPLVGAGPDRVVDAGGPISLDGSSTKAGRPGGLDLRWTIVAAPRGSKAHLAGARSKRPRLLGASHGRYRLALRAVQGGSPGSTASGARASASATAAGVGADQVGVCVQPNVLPMGVPIETIVSDSHPQVNVDHAPYPMSNPGASYAQVVVLDRCSLEVISNKSYTPASIVEMAEEIKALPSSDIVILSGGGGAANDVNANAFGPLVSSIESIGGIFGFNAKSESLVEGDYSVIGVPGMAPGEATELFGHNRSGAVVGDIEGLLQLDSTESGFTFVWPTSQVTFDTAAPGSNATTSIIEVGGVGYPEHQSEPGFHLVWLDPTTLHTDGEESFPVSEIGFSTFVDRLGIAEGEGSIIFVSSYGSPNVRGYLKEKSNSPNGLSLLAQKLENFGANPYAFLGLSGNENGGYSFVGADGLKGLEGQNAGLELVQELAKSKTSRITGELALNHQGAWLPANNGSPESLSGDPVGESIIKDVILHHSHPFKPLNYAAEEYIYSKLKLNGGEPMNPLFGIRSYFWKHGVTATEYGEDAGEIGKMTSCTEPEDCVEHFEEVQDVLYREFRDVAKVKRFFTTTGEGAGTLAKIFQVSYAGYQGSDYESIKDAIKDVYTLGSERVRSESTEDIVSGSLTIGEGVVGLVPVVGEEASAFLSIVQGSNEIAAGLDRESDGSSGASVAAFEGEALEWATHVELRQKSIYQTLEKVADLMVSDEGRLETLYELIDTSTRNGGLHFYDDDEEEALEAALERSTARYLWLHMLPVPVRTTLPFNGPFNLPVTPLVSGEGVVEVTAAVGKGKEATLVPEQTIGAIALPADGRLLEKQDVSRLYEELPSNSTFTTSDPLGFVPEFFLAPAVPLDNGSVSAGFLPMKYCELEPIHNYENFIHGEVNGEPENQVPCYEP